MDFYSLSLPEASYLYLGLSLQALLRQSSLRHLPATIDLVWTFILLCRASRRPGGYQVLGGYLVTSFLVLCLFWPESLALGGRLDRVTGPEQVASYAASQDPQADVVTAADTGQVPAPLYPPALIPPGFRLLLRGMTETPLALARTINSTTHRTFASLLPMQWLLGVDLTADVTTAIADWVHACFLPVYTGTMEGQEGRTMHDLLPWGDSPMRRGLTTRSVIPGSQTGITWMRGPTSDNSVRCDVYLDAVEFRTQAWLYELRSPNGTPLSEVFQEELGLATQEQARFLLYREMIRAAGPAVPAPSLTAQYGLLRGAGIAGAGLAKGASAGGTVGAAGGWWAGAVAFFSSGAGAVGAASAHEFQRAVDGLSWIVGLAVFLTWWGPYIIGIVNLVLIGLFPFVVLWSFLPGNAFQVLAQYFVTLLFTCSVPFFWALIDQAQRLAAVLAPMGTTPLLGGLTGFAWSTMVTVLGILLVPVIVGMVLFASFRGIGSLWRGGI